MLCACVRIRCLSSSGLFSAMAIETHARPRRAVLAAIMAWWISFLFILFGNGGLFSPSLHVDSLGEKPSGERSFAEQAADRDERQQIRFERQVEKVGEAVCKVTNAGNEQENAKPMRQKRRPANQVTNRKDMASEEDHADIVHLHAQGQKCQSLCLQLCARESAERLVISQDVERRDE